MNLPNKLTVFRIMLIPIIVFSLCSYNWKYNFLCAFIVFLLASYTDQLDGYIARKNNLITDFGKIMDPLADKILVSSVFICFTGMRLVSPLAAVLIVCREFIVTSVRLLILEHENKVVAANIFGKLKTVSQIIAIIFVFLNQILFKTFNLHFLYNIINLQILFFIQNLLVWISVILSFISGFIYIINNKKFIKID